MAGTLLTFDRQVEATRSRTARADRLAHATRPRGTRYPRVRDLVAALHPEWTDARVVAVAARLTR